MFRKLLVLSILFFASISASAEFRWGPTVGANFMSMHWKQDIAKTSLRTGFQAGVLGELMIPGIGFGIDLGLKYKMDGSYVNFGDHLIWSSTGIKNQDVRFHTIEIPINLKFKWTRMNGFERILAPFVYAGPTFNFIAATNDAPAIEHPLGYVGIQVAAGGEFFEHYQISAGYCWGVSYQCKTIKLDNYSEQPRSWFVNLTYLF